MEGTVNEPSGNLDQLTIVVPGQRFIVRANSHVAKAALIVLQCALQQFQQIAFFQRPEFENLRSRNERRIHEEKRDGLAPILRRKTLE